MEERENKIVQIFSWRQSADKNITSERGVFFPQVTQDDTLSVSLGAIHKTDTSNRDASLL
jgi:hypothetical protein